MIRMSLMAVLASSTTLIGVGQAHAQVLPDGAQRQSGPLPAGFDPAIWIATPGKAPLLMNTDCEGQALRLPAGAQGAGAFDRPMSGKAGWNGGAKRIRTAGLLIANEALYQLSYSPIPFRRRTF